MLQRCRPSVPFTLSSQLLLNPWGIWMKPGTKKDHNMEMCILQWECCPIFFKGVRAPVSIIHAGVSCTGLAVPYFFLNIFKTFKKSDFCINIFYGICIHCMFENAGFSSDILSCCIDKTSHPQHSMTAIWLAFVADRIYFTQVIQEY